MCTSTQRLSLCGHKRMNCQTVREWLARWAGCGWRQLSGETAHTCIILHIPTHVHNNYYNRKIRYIHSMPWRHISIALFSWLCRCHWNSCCMYGVSLSGSYVADKLPSNASSLARTAVTHTRTNIIPGPRMASFYCSSTHAASLRVSHPSSPPVFVRDGLASQTSRER